MGIQKLYLHQELLLLILDDSGGSFDGTMYHYGLAGSILSELILLGSIKITDEDRKMVHVALSKRIGDEVLDEVLQMVVDANKPKSLQQWVTEVASIKELEHRIASRLCDLGILQQDEKKILWLFTQRVYPELDGSFENSIRSRMAEVMFTPEQKADERTAAIIAFAKSCGVLEANFAKVELKQHQQRIDDICQGRILATGATDEAIAAVQTAIMVATIASTVAITAATTATR